MITKFIKPKEPVMLTHKNCQIFLRKQLLQQNAAVVREKDEPKTHKRNKYQESTAEVRAIIAKYATENGILKACRKFSIEMGRSFAPSTIFSSVSKYKEELKSNEQVTSIELLKRGSLTLFPLNWTLTNVKFLLKSITKNGGLANKRIIRAVALVILEL